MLTLSSGGAQARPTDVVSRQVSIVGGSGLPKVDRFGSCDAFSVVYWNHQQIGRTDVAKDSLDPRWA